MCARARARARARAGVTMCERDEDKVGGKYAYGCFRGRVCTIFSVWGGYGQ